MSTLALAMIVKNEEGCLRDCLASAAAIVDETVIGDTGSTDGTAAIAAEFGAKVLKIAWNDDFSAARNAVLEHVRSDWILHMDADEVLDAQGAACLRSVVDSDGAGADAIQVILANYSNDIQAWRWKPARPGDLSARGYTGYIEVPLLRLFRNNPKFRYREAVHENITESVTEHGGVVRQEPVVIHHYGYACEESKRAEKALVYLGIAAKKTQTRPGDPKSWHDFAELALSCGKVNEAESALRQALALSPLYQAATMTLATILLNRGDLDAAESILANLAAHGIAPPHALAALGGIALRRGNLRQAYDFLSAALDAAPETITARLLVARVHDCSDRPQSATRELENCLQLAPASVEVRNRVCAHQTRLLAEQRYGQGEPNNALALFTESLRLDPDDPVTYNDLGVVLAAMGLPQEAKKRFRQALTLVNNMPQAAANLARLEITRC